MRRRQGPARRCWNRESRKKREGPAIPASERAMPAPERGRGADRGNWGCSGGPRLAKGTVNDAASLRTTKFSGNTERLAIRVGPGLAEAAETVRRIPCPVRLCGLERECIADRARRTAWRWPGSNSAATIVCTLPADYCQAHAQQVEFRTRQRFGYRDDQVEHGRT